MRFRTGILAALMAAFVVFCVMQDRITAAGARQYVALQRAAWAGQGAPVTIAAIVEPAVSRSVRVALMWSGLVFLLGAGAAGTLARRVNRS
jgi:hypothetical protein